MNPRIILQIGISITLFTASFTAAAVSCPQAPSLPLAQNAPTITVTNEQELQSAVSSAASGSVINIQPGTYNLSSTLYVRTSDITITGPDGSCDAVVLAGKGMDNSNYGQTAHGIWTDAPGLTVRNLTIKDVYYHSIALNHGAESPLIYNVKMLDAGEQFIKASSAPDGNYVDNGRVEYSVMAYSTTPPVTDHGGGTGYTNGVDVHGGHDWVIRNNLFKNLHTPDSADNLWNPAILMWKGATNTLTENNIFIDCDRAISYGLHDYENGSDHVGGIIRNNMLYYSPGLYSSSRKYESDGAIIVWDSTNTKVYHNTALINGNINNFIQFRFTTTGSEARNNLSDGSINSRSGAQFASENNISNATSSLFVSPADGNLRLVDSAPGILGTVEFLQDATLDIDGQARSQSGAHPGADQLHSLAPPKPPTDVRGSSL